MSNARLNLLYQYNLDPSLGYSMVSKAIEESLKLFSSSLNPAVLECSSYCATNQKQRYAIAKELNKRNNTDISTHCQVAFYYLMRTLFPDVALDTISLLMQSRYYSIICKQLLHSASLEEIRKIISSFEQEQSFMNHNNSVVNVLGLQLEVDNSCEFSVAFDGNLNRKLLTPTEEQSLETFKKNLMLFKSLTRECRGLIFCYFDLNGITPETLNVIVSYWRSINENPNLVSMVELERMRAFAKMYSHFLKDEQNKIYSSGSIFANENFRPIVNDDMLSFKDKLSKFCPIDNRKFAVFISFMPPECSFYIDENWSLKKMVSLALHPGLGLSDSSIIKLVEFLQYEASHSFQIENQEEVSVKVSTIISAIRMGCTDVRYLHMLVSGQHIIDCYGSPEYEIYTPNFYPNLMYFLNNNRGIFDYKEHYFQNFSLDSLERVPFDKLHSCTFVVEDIFARNKDKFPDFELVEFQAAFFEVVLDSIYYSDSKYVLTECERVLGSKEYFEYVKQALDKLDVKSECEIIKEDLISDVTIQQTDFSDVTADVIHQKVVNIDEVLSSVPQDDSRAEELNGVQMLESFVPLDTPTSFDYYVINIYGNLIRVDSSYNFYNIEGDKVSVPQLAAVESVNHLLFEKNLTLFRSLNDESRALIFHFFELVEITPTVLEVLVTCFATINARVEYSDEMKLQRIIEFARVYAHVSKCETNHISHYNSFLNHFDIVNESMSESMNGPITQIKEELIECSGNTSDKKFAVFILLLNPHEIEYICECPHLFGFVVRALNRGVKFSDLDIIHLVEFLRYEISNFYHEDEIDRNIDIFSKTSSIVYIINKGITDVRVLDIILRTDAIVSDYGYAYVKLTAPNVYPNLLMLFDSQPEESQYMKHFVQTANFIRLEYISTDDMKMCISLVKSMFANGIVAIPYAERSVLEAKLLDVVIEILYSVQFDYSNSGVLEKCKNFLRSKRCSEFITTTLGVDYSVYIDALRQMFFGVSADNEQDDLKSGQSAVGVSIRDVSNAREKFVDDRQTNGESSKLNNDVDNDPIPVNGKLIVQISGSGTSTSYYSDEEEDEDMTDQLEKVISEQTEEGNKNVTEQLQDVVSVKKDDNDSTKEHKAVAPASLEHEKLLKKENFPAVKKGNFLFPAEVKPGALFNNDVSPICLDPIYKNSFSLIELIKRFFECMFGFSTKDHEKEEYEDRQKSESLNPPDSFGGKLAYFQGLINESNTENENNAKSRPTL